MNVQSYVMAQSCDEAYNLLQKDPKNKILGGGAWLKISVKEIHNLISLEALNLNGISESEGIIRIGAMTCLHEIELNDVIQTSHSGILNQAISKIMGMNIRNLATIGGSVMGRFSFSDLIPVLLVMDASLVFHHHGRVSIQDFLNDRKYLKDILKYVEIKKSSDSGYFKKVSITALDFSIVNIAMIKGKTIKIAVGSRPGMAELALKAMAFINQEKTIDEHVIDRTASIAIDELNLGENLRGSKAYRETLVKTYIKRGLRQVIQ